MSDLKSMLTPGMINAAVQKSRWDNQYRGQFWRLLHKAQEDVVSFVQAGGVAWTERFYVLLDHFRGLVVERMGKRRGKPVEDAADEFFRLAVVNEPREEEEPGREYNSMPEDPEPLSYEEALGFLARYKLLKQRISVKLSPLFDWHGDGFGDLTDSFPMGGRVLIDRALKTEYVERGFDKRPVGRDGFLSESEVYGAIKDAGEPWAAFVGGENYVESALEEAARSWLLHWMKSRVMTYDQGEYIESCKLED